MKKEQKEQVKTFLKDTNTAVASWVKPIQEEQKKLFDLIRVENKQVERFKDMHYNRIPKEEDFYNKWSESNNNLDLLSACERYYNKLFEKICDYASLKVYYIATLLCESKRDLTDLLHMVDYENSSKNYLSFYTNLVGDGLYLTSHLHYIYPSLTSCLYCNKKTYLSIFNKNIVSYNWREQKTSFVELSTNEQMELLESIESRFITLGKEINEDFNKINLDYVLENVINVYQLKRKQEQEHNDFLNKQREELKEQDILSVSSYLK